LNLLSLVEKTELRRDKEVCDSNDTVNSLLFSCGSGTSCCSA